MVASLPSCRISKNNFKLNNLRSLPSVKPLEFATVFRGFIWLLNGFLFFFRCFQWKNFSPKQERFSKDEVVYVHMCLQSSIDIHDVVRENFRQRKTADNDLRKILFLEKRSWDIRNVECNWNVWKKVQRNLSRRVIASLPEIGWF